MASAGLQRLDGENTWSPESFGYHGELELSRAAVNRREESLDSMRGIAAVLVLLSHTTIAGLYKVEPLWSVLKWTPLRFFWSGHQAVILFFLLSGFALTRMWQSMGESGYTTYLASRVFRLYPPYLFSVALAFAVCQFLAHSGFEWAAGWMNIPNPVLSSVSIVDHLLMIGAFNTSEINPPIWSIVHEMRISIVFPLIFIVVDRFRGYAVTAFCMSSLLVSWLISGVVALKPIQAELLLSLHYSTFFALGTYVALKSDSIVNSVASMSRALKATSIGVGMLLYSYPFDNPWSLSQRVIGDLGIGVGAVVLISIALWYRKPILGRAGDFLGKISYSLYLNHILVLNVLLVLILKEAGPISVWLSVVPLAIFFAYIAWKFVEVPSIEFSRRVRRRLRRQPA